MHQHARAQPRTPDAQALGRVMLENRVGQRAGDEVGPAELYLSGIRSARWRISIIAASCSVVGAGVADENARHGGVDGA